MPKKKGFVKATKSKVIFALLLACFALFIAWNISKVVFQEMLVTVDDISAPSKRLNLVNSVSRKISSLDQQQKNQAIQTPGNYSKLFKESFQLRKSLDSLALLYARDSVQIARLRTIQTLLVERDKQFLDYLKVRATLVNNQSFSKQVKALNALASKGSEAADSTVLATEESTSTTTFSPEDKKPRSLLAKIFGKRKEEGDQTFTIISQRKIKTDTISLSTEDQRAKDLGASLKNIEREQRKRNNSFVNREAGLANANSVLIVQMLEVLREVENEVVSQIESNAIQAREVVNDGISKITIVMIVFFFLTIILLWLILTDITRSNRYRYDLEVAKDEAEYHGKAKQRFLANMSHEIRTPLQSIIGYSELLVKEQHYDERHVKAISQSSEHLLQIVNEVLDYNRIISGKFTFDQKPFSMLELLNEVIAVIKPQATAKSLRLVTDFDVERLGKLEGDSFRLKQILLNLLGNAIKFTNVGEVCLAVRFKAKDDQAYLTFTVKDTGIGMSEADAEIVFNEFEQSKPMQREFSSQEGAGLGLTIVKALVENQNGRIYLTSKLGKGSTFTVYLAFNALDSSTEPVEIGSITLQRLTGMVWIVDDDPLILNLCEIFLSKQTIKYKSFNSSLAVLQEPLPEDLSHILMDMRMPEMDGIELCTRLRSNVSPDVKIVAMTAQVLPSEQDDLMRRGFDGLLMKPFKMKELLAIIMGHIPINLDSLKQMTFNDPVLLQNIIRSFSRDCLEDEQLILNAMNVGDWDTVTLVTHRLAGRLGQMGVTGLASSFRDAELSLRLETNVKEDMRAGILSLLRDLHTVVDQFKHEGHEAYSIS